MSKENVYEKELNDIAAKTQRENGLTPKEVDYKKECYMLLDFIADVGLQLQVYSKNTKDRIAKVPQWQA